MRVSYLIELLKNTNIAYQSLNDKKDVRYREDAKINLKLTEKDNESISIEIRSLDDIRKNNEILNKEINKIESLDFYTYYINLSLNVENKEYTDNTLGNLFAILNDSYILWSSLNNKYIEVIVLSSQGKGVYYFKGIEVDLFNKPSPWGWDKLKNMTVKEIKEINNMKTSFMQIVVSDE